MDAYPAAERVAWDLPLETEDVEALLVLWLDAYQVRFRRAPGDPEVQAAKLVLERRIAGALPPLPTSPGTSGTSWGVPCLETGVPRDEGE